MYVNLIDNTYLSTRPKCAASRHINVIRIIHLVNTIDETAGQVGSPDGESLPRPKLQK